MTMTRDRAKSIRIGDTLRPIPLWNQTERKINHLPDRCEVTGIKEARCELGVMVCVKTEGGAGRWLSAGWFE